VVTGEPLGARDLLHVARRFQLMTLGTNRSKSVGVVRVIAFVTEGEGRAVVEDKEAQDQSRAAVEATPVLTQQDLGPKPPGQETPLTAIIGGFASPLG
jgi:hypothetical protein